MEPSTTYLRALFDLAIEQLTDDSQLLEAAGLDREADESHACAVMLMAGRAAMLRRAATSGHAP